MNNEVYSTYLFEEMKKKYIHQCFLPTSLVMDKDIQKDRKISYYFDLNFVPIFVEIKSEGLNKCVCI